MSGNPMLAWSLERMRRDRKAIFACLIFLALFYGMVGLASLIWSYTIPSSRRLQDLGTTYYYLAWSVNALILLLWAPSRLAQTLAQERSRGTLDMLRLTGLGGWSLTIGYAGTALLLPALLCLLTLPVIFLGSLGSVDSMATTVRGYVGLLPLAVIYTLGAGLVGLAVKKAQNAGSAAIFGIMLLIGITAATNLSEIPDFKPLSLLGPWGSGMSTLHDHEFRLVVLGVVLPGEVLQIPFQATVLCALGLGMARRLSGREGGLMGPLGALLIAAAVTVVGGITFFPDVDPSIMGRRNIPTRMALTMHLVCVFAATLLLALELPVRWRSLVRGFARRDPDDPAFPDERLTVLRFLPGLVLPAGMAVIMIVPFLYAREAAAGGPPLVAISGLSVAVLLMASSWLFAALVFQIVQLWLRDRNSPLIVSILMIALLWFGPFAASYGLRQLAAPPALYELPRIASPFYGLYAAAHCTSGAATASVDPLALATACALLYACLSGGLLQLLRVFVQRAEEHAETLVALPADAYGAPGTLTQRCERGHLYSETWTQCPHCAES